MKMQDMLAICGIAAATMVVTLALARPRQVTAIDPSADGRSEIRPMISQPVLDISGLQVKLTMDKPSYVAGATPEITIEATNPTDQRIETSVWIGMTSSTIAAMLSRAPTMPEYIWSETCPLAVERGETQTVRIIPGKELVAGNTVSVTMSATDQKAAIAKLLQVREGTEDSLHVSAPVPGK